MIPSVEPQTAAGYTSNASRPFLSAFLMREKEKVKLTWLPAVLQKKTHVCMKSIQCFCDSDARGEQRHGAPWYGCMHAPVFNVIYHLARSLSSGVTERRLQPAAAGSPAPPPAAMTYRKQNFVRVNKAHRGYSLHSIRRQLGMKNGPHRSKKVFFLVVVVFLLTGGSIWKQDGCNFSERNKKSASPGGA